MPVQVPVQLGPEVGAERASFLEDVCALVWSGDLMERLRIVRIAGDGAC